MKKTFVCDETMLITIPIGSLRDTGEGQLMPEHFLCVYKDNYKIFAVNGKSKPLGAAQTLTGVFIIVLSLLFTDREDFNTIHTVPSALFVLCGLVSYAAGQHPNMHLTKLSFSLNIASFFWSIAAVSLCFVKVYDKKSPNNQQLREGIKGLIVTLLVVEKLIAVSMIYWLSKAICRQHFNTLPIILLKRED